MVRCIRTDSGRSASTPPNSWWQPVVTSSGTRAGLASLVFAMVDILPLGWRALYILGGSALLILAYYRRWLPETLRFEVRRSEIAALESKTTAAFETVRRLVRDYPGRLSALLVALVSACALPEAVAVPTIRLSDGVNTVTVADGSALDFAPNPAGTSAVGPR